MVTQKKEERPTESSRGYSRQLHFCLYLQTSLVA